MTVYMFPGQGSQVKGMGGDLFSRFPSEVKQANEILGYSVEDLCLNDPGLQLSETKYTQPALYLVEALSFIARQADASTLNYLIGHSLGEYAALFASGGFDLFTGLKLVQKRGELMSKAVDGSMLAVINLAPDRITILLQAHELNGIDVANYNSSKQIVLSGTPADISQANEILSKEAMICVPLKVSGAFHSRYMQPAAKEFEQYIEQFTFTPLRAQVISNATARPYTFETIKELLVKQITHSVLWSESIRYLKGQGESEFIEIGPGKVLTGLMAQN